MNFGTLKIKSSYAINPFFWYSVIWFAVLILYNLNYSTLYEPLDTGLLIFLALTIFFALIIGTIFQFYLKKLKFVSIKYKTKYCSTFLITLLFVIEFIYCGYIPLFNPGNYHDFGIPTLHVFNITYAIYVYVYLNVLYFTFKEKKHLLQILLLVFLFLLIYSRGLLVFLLFMSLLLFIATHKVHLKIIIISLLLVIFSLFVFGCMGNIRSGSDWNDSSYILNIAKINQKNFPLPSQFSWAYIYLISPLGNLNHEVLHATADNSLYGLFSQIIFDFISKRIFDYKLITISSIQPLLTVKTCYSPMFLSFGYMGMIIAFISMILFFTIVFIFCHKNGVSLVIILLVISSLFALTFFDNMFAYSGYSFSVVYAVIASIFCKINIPKIYFLKRW